MYFKYLFQLLNNIGCMWVTAGTFSASEVTTLWRYTNLFIIIIIIIMHRPIGAIGVWKIGNYVHS